MFDSKRVHHQAIIFDFFELFLFFFETFLFVSIVWFVCLLARSFEHISKNSSRRCDRFGPKIIQFRAILAIFRPFEDFCFFDSEIFLIKKSFCEASHRHSHWRSHRHSHTPTHSHSNSHSHVFYHALIWVAKPPV